MNSSCEVVYAFIPCYNRRDVTVSFIDHLIYSWPVSILLNIHLLDCGSSDGSAAAVSFRWPSVTVHSLDSTFFWGASLNYIQSLLRKDSLFNHINYCDPWILILNDDLRFKDGALSLACSLLSGFDILAPNIEGGPGKVFFNPVNGSFGESADCGESNLGTTRATFLRRSTWLQAEPIVKGIPHYLSDYWFTYSLSCKGFRISTIPGYSVICRSDTTRLSGPNGIGLGSRFTYWCSCLDPRSPDYLIAYITFKRRFSREPFILFSLILMKLKFSFYKLVTCYHPGNIAQLQG